MASEEHLIDEQSRVERCQARHGQYLTLRCVEVHRVVPENVRPPEHEHWAVNDKGETVRWRELVAMYPAIDGNFHGYGGRMVRDVTWEEVIPARFETKDSGVRAEYDSGMVRDTQEGKARFELLLPRGVPYRDQFLVRVAELMARGAEKYTSRNWEKANGTEELERFKSSALRHLMQWAAGETDEDHAAAVVFNLLGYETTKRKIDG